MLTVGAARELGIRTCVEAIGKEFALAHRKSSCSMYGTQKDPLSKEDIVNCFVGVAETLPSLGENVYTLTEEDKWAYYARCYVYIKNGKTKIVDLRAPSHKEHR